MTTGTDQLRRRHTALVVRTLRRLGPTSRAELAVATGLSKPTIGAIVASLEADGTVGVDRAADDRLGDDRVPVRGRPGRPVALRPGRHLGLGLDLNVDYVTAVVLDLTGDVVLSESRPVAEDRVEALLAVTRDLRDRYGAGRFVGVTAAVPALVHGDDRTVAWAPNLTLAGPELADALAGLLPDSDVRVVNDANCAAYAEVHHGVARGVDHALYVTGTVGIGVGIVAGGVLVQGATGFAGEAGHVAVGDPTARCGCGRRGCWEASVGLHAVLRALGMEELGTPTATAEAVAARAARDAGAQQVLARVGRDLGLGLATLTSVLDPEVVVLGGYFVPLGDLVLDHARAALDDRLDPPGRRRPELRLSTLGLGAAALGAAEQALAGVLLG
ncbi:ROK family transcriptional regulator [Nocardioides sp. 1609]|uniref:ROK family transcriptional regulator n=1 Tax=Nocardioides sp. 1609 TaxID=2508327 RepID=UPI00107057A0|nr:ROK family transcriptional regulator [Nocardioides sp. 1609]